MAAQAFDIKTWIRDKHWAHGEYRKARGKQLIMPAKTRALGLPIHCLNVAENKEQLLKVFNSASTATPTICGLSR